ncbi:SIR2 family protein [Rhizobium leguminosarum]|uniref:SIR2 family protein n=1 Tax=Rhizobium leguminosarum TaxID=384 RepID=UPI00144255AE|nr:SIR2 family protein [Rhizobium leguminosarum]NKM96152.1 hypothetical protein [Rhizobium leguminosarum bv. viciae]
MIPSTLIDALVRGEVVLFFGAGVNHGSTHPDGRVIPLGNGLRDLLADRFLNGECKERSLEEVATLAVNEVGRRSVFRFVAEQITGFPPGAGQKLLPGFRWKAIFTLNYDRLVEEAYEQSKASLQHLKVFFKDQNGIDREISAVPNSLPYYKLHGSVDSLYDGEAPLILTSDTYIEYENNRKRLFRRLEDLAHEYPIVFAGSGLTDPHIKVILAQVEKDASSRPMYYFVSPTINQYDEALLGKKRMTPIKATFDNFMEEINVLADPTARKLYGVIKPGNHSIEKFFRRNVSAPDSLVAFLTNNVDHVRAGIPTTTVLAETFFKGESQSWAPIEQEFDIERLLYSTLMLKVLGLDKSDDVINVVGIRGVAGAGKTVLLRRIAYDLSVSHGKLVLFAPPGANLRPEPLVELHELTGLQIILVVDHAADQIAALTGVLDRLDALNIRITVLIADTNASFGNSLDSLGERLKFKAELRNLNDQEIDSLLDKLSKHKSLGLLANEPRDKQKEAFEKVAEKQLLVALYEATQGKLLENILLEEYHRILLSEAQDLYLLVCTLNRFRVPVRAALVHRVMGLGYRDFERRFLGPLSGMVFAEIDPSSGDYAYRARHPHVADIVFRRVLDSQSKQLNQYRRIIENINTTYSSDNDAMRRMLTFKNLRELALGLEERRELLDLAQRVCGDDTFILQQQAITEMNDGKGDLAIAWQRLEKAEALKPRDTSIQHTKASLLARQANQTKDGLQRRSLRSDAKEVLRKVSDGDRSDAYVCSLRAKIAIDEIEEHLSNGSFGQAEIARLSEDAQKSLTKGLSTAPDFEALVKENYRLRRVLGTGDRGIAMLERTLKEQPHLEYVAAIYARAIFQKDPEKAFLAIRTGLQQRPQSKLLNQTYFELLIEKSDDFRDELALPLRRSFTPEDQNLIMHIHSIRYFYMRGDRAEFNAAVAAADKMRMPNYMKNIPRFPVRNESSTTGRWRGEVSHLGPATGYLKLAGMIGDVFVRATAMIEEDLWDHLASGKSVYFDLKFNCKGPVAENVSREELFLETQADGQAI